MMKASPNSIGLTLLLLTLLSACSSNSEKNKAPLVNQTIEERNIALSKISSWKLTGKIAFIQPEQRQSASIIWSKKNEAQQVDLTSYLGINVLHLSSIDNVHTVKIDGKKYQSDNLDKLLYKLTGFTLPTKALSFWVKGIAYESSDHIIYHDKTSLPSRLTSYYGGKFWEINYTKYTPINSLQLASTITVVQGDLLIKILIKKWTF